LWVTSLPKLGSIEVKKQLLAMIVLSAFVVGNINAEAPDWNYDIKKEMTDDCVLGILEPAKSGFLVRANKEGNTDAVFPEEKIKPSIADFCECIIQKASISWGYQYFIWQPELAQQLVSEAMKGGECKPTGMLGKSLGY